MDNNLNTEVSAVWDRVRSSTRVQEVPQGIFDEFSSYFFADLRKKMRYIAVLEKRAMYFETLRYSKAQSSSGLGEDFPYEQRINQSILACWSRVVGLRQAIDTLPDQYVHKISERHDLILRNQSETFCSDDDCTRCRVRKGIQFLDSPHLREYQRYEREGLLSECDLIGFCVCERSAIEPYSDSCMPTPGQFSDEISRGDLTVLGTSQKLLMENLEKRSQEIVDAIFSSS